MIYFQELASLVPTIGSPRRLTKNHVVNETINYLQRQKKLCAIAVQDMNDFLIENRRLASEINAIRSQNGQGQLPFYQPRGPSKAMLQLAGMKDRTDEVSPVADGENWSWDPNDMSVSENDRNLIESSRAEIPILPLSTSGQIDPEEPLAHSISISSSVHPICAMPSSDTHEHRSEGAVPSFDFEAQYASNSFPDSFPYAIDEFQATCNPQFFLGTPDASSIAGGSFFGMNESDLSAFSDKHPTQYTCGDYIPVGHL